MPLTSKGETIKATLQEQYGEKKGTSVLYAGKNKGTFTGIDEALTGERRGREIFYGGRDNQPMLVTTPNAGVPGYVTQTDDDDED